MIRKFLLATCLILASCSGTDKEFEKQTAEEIYTAGKAEFDKGDYKDGAKLFEEVEKQHPLSDWANKGQIMAGYGYYKQKDYTNAIFTMQRFIKFHPNSSNTPYAYYLIALSYYVQISDVQRDQKITQQAMASLKQVVNRYPNTYYGKDAKYKLALTVNHLAGKEMAIGRFYLKKKNYIGAINRFKYVINNYDITSHTPEALHRLVECYMSLGIVDEARRYAAVLGHNYPESKWYKRSYELLNN